MLRLCLAPRRLRLPARLRAAWPRLRNASTIAASTKAAHHRCDCEPPVRRRRAVRLRRHPRACPRVAARPRHRQLGRRGRRRHRGRRRPRGLARLSGRARRPRPPLLVTVTNRGPRSARAAALRVFRPRHSRGCALRRLAAARRHRRRLLRRSSWSTRPWASACPHPPVPRRSVWAAASCSAPTTTATATPPASTTPRPLRHVAASPARRCPQPRRADHRLPLLRKLADVRHINLLAELVDLVSRTLFWPPRHRLRLRRLTRHCREPRCAPVRPPVEQVAMDMSPRTSMPAPEGQCAVRRSACSPSSPVTLSVARPRPTSHLALRSCPIDQPTSDPAPADRTALPARPRPSRQSRTLAPPAPVGRRLPRPGARGSVGQ